MSETASPPVNNVIEKVEESAIQDAGKEKYSGVLDSCMDHLDILQL